MNRFIATVLQIAGLAVLIYALAFGASELMPEPPAPVPPCSCEDKPDDCEVRHFDIYDGRHAHCAIWSTDSICCVAPAEHQL